jgi:hypothetical protein
MKTIQSVAVSVVLAVGSDRPPPPGGYGAELPLSQPARRLAYS